MLNHDTIETLLDMHEADPKAVTVAAFLLGSLWVALDLGWMGVCVPALVSAHDDSSLLLAITGSVLLVALNAIWLLDVAAIDRAYEERQVKKNK